VGLVSKQIYSPKQLQHCRKVSDTPLQDEVRTHLPSSDGAYWPNERHCRIVSLRDPKLLTLSRKEFQSVQSPSSRDRHQGERESTKQGLICRMKDYTHASPALPHLLWMLGALLAIIYTPAEDKHTHSGAHSGSLS
jgi:hypothetical protein